jgi:nitroreductase
MELIELLHERRSTPVDRLAAPAPAGADLEAILRAGVSAPDHDRLRPWRFLLVQGDARARLGEVFAAAAAQRDPGIGPEALERQRGKPLRAPLIIVVAARIDPDNARVPEIEQALSAGAALHQMQLAAAALGYGAIWLTGPNAHDANVAEALGLEIEDRVVGFLHVGTITDSRPPGPERPATAAHVEHWTRPCSHDTP